LLLNHRLICAPLKLDRFLSPLKISSDYGMKTIIWFGEPLNVNSKFPGSLYGTLLNTRNGPNYYSNEFSGHALASMGNHSASPYDVFIFPDILSYNVTMDYQNLHQDLRRMDGDVFVVMFRAGRSYYTQPIDDPFYAAHERIITSSGVGDYAPDYEATALGCVEQYQYCLDKKPRKMCTHFNSSNDMINAALFILALENTGDLKAVTDFKLSTYALTHVGSVRSYLTVQTGTKLLLTSIFRRGDHVAYIDPLEQWVQEVQTWFETSFLRARFYWLQVVQPEGTPPQKPNISNPFDRVHLCDRILFFDDDYSNIDFIGLMATISTILILFILSFMVKMIKIFKVFMHICYIIYLAYHSVSSWAQGLGVRRQTRPTFPQSQFWHWWRDNRFHGRYPQANEDIDLDETRLSRRLQSIRQAPQVNISPIP
jgi:hypothetical protein